MERQSWSDRAHDSFVTRHQLLLVVVQKSLNKVRQRHSVHRWLKSDSARSFVGFLLALNDAVRGKRLGDPVPGSPAIEAMLQVPSTSSSAASAAACHCAPLPACCLALLITSAVIAQSWRQYCQSFWQSLRKDLADLPIATSGTMYHTDEH